MRILQRETLIDLKYASYLISDHLSYCLQNSINSINSLGFHLTRDSTLPDYETFDNYFKEIIMTTSMLNKLQIVNEKGIIVYELPHDTNIASPNLDLKPLKDWTYLEEARKSGTTVIGPYPNTLVQGTSCVIICNPLYHKDTFLGWIQGIYGIEDFLQGSEYKLSPNYTIQLRDAKDSIILGNKTISDISIKIPISVNKQLWQLQVASRTIKNKRDIFLLILILLGELSVIYIILWNLFTYWKKEEILSLTVHKQSIKLKENEFRSRTTLEQAPIGIVQISVDGRFQRVNKAFCKMLGYTNKELLEKRSQDLTPSQGQLEDLNYISRLLSKEDKANKYQWEKCYIRKDGQLLWVNVNASVIRNEWGIPLYIISTIMDINAKKEAEIIIQQNMKELRDLTNRMSYSEEITRKEIALEIHDDIGQRLTALGLALDITLKRLSRKGDDIIAPLREARGELDSTIESIHNIVDGLHPLILDDCGLSAAIRWNIEIVERRSRLKFIVNVPDLSHSLPENIEIGIFRILQEALNNIVRHSQASEVSIELSEAPPAVSLKIIDNGIGLDDKKDIEKIPSTGHGLISMRERAKAMDGELIFCSNQEGGTVLELIIGNIS